MSRIKLVATEGMVYTNGKDYAKVAFLHAGDSADNWWEITEEEYKRVTAESAEGEIATAADYEAALRDMGVKV